MASVTLRREPVGAAYRSKGAVLDCLFQVLADPTSYLSDEVDVPPHLVCVRGRHRSM
jgi:hypothetical protein